jgi:hypothetical protein
MKQGKIAYSLVRSTYLKCRLEASSDFSQYHSLLTRISLNFQILNIYMHTRAFGIFHYLFFLKFTKFLYIIKYSYNKFVSVLFSAHYCRHRRENLESVPISYAISACPLTSHVTVSDLMKAFSQNATFEGFNEI